MGNSKFGMEYLANPPEKVRLMFQAVNELIATKADISSMKVQDITVRAGIGKGTAYEYFSSKEELIMMALLYDYGKKIMELAERLEDKECFADKIFGILDWLHDNSGYHMTFVHMLSLSTGGADFCEVLKNQFPGDVLGRLHAYLLGNGDAIMEQGYREGVISEKDIGKRRLAFASMVVQLVLTLEGTNSASVFDIEYGQMRQYAYDTLVKTLS